MADENSSAGLSIPGSSRKKKTTYSVSLRENNFDISEVFCEDDDHEVVEESSKQHRTPARDKCQTCGQRLPGAKNRTPVKLTINEETSPSSQLSRSLPTDLPAIPSSQ